MISTSSMTANGIVRLNLHLYSLTNAGVTTSREEQLEQLAHSHFSVSFEEATEHLQEIDRLCVEPDGSFVWVGDKPEPWQVDGMLYDHSGRLHRVELKGSCPRVAWDRLLTAFGATHCSVAIDVLDAQQRWLGLEVATWWESQRG